MKQNTSHLALTHPCPTLLKPLAAGDTGEGKIISIKATGAYSINNLNHTVLGSYVFHPTVGENSGNYLYMGNNNIPLLNDSTANTQEITATANCSVVAFNPPSSVTTVCANATSTYNFPITVNGTSPAITLISNVSIPLGCSVDLTASSNQGSSYFTWYPGTYLDKVTGATVTVTPTLVGTYIYYVLAESIEENPNGCCAADSVVVTTYYYNPVITYTNCTFYCHSGEPELLVSPAVNGATYQWYRSINNGASYSIISGATNEDYTETVNSTRIYKVIISNDCLDFTLYKHVYVNSDPPCDLRLEENDSGEVNSQTEFICYPNPASDEVNLMINTPDKKLNAAMQVVNMFGQKIYDERIIVNNNYTKQLKQHWNDGVYLIILNTGNETLKQIITIQH